jgi:hypothetical protein
MAMTICMAVKIVECDAIVWQKFTDVLEAHTASICRVKE